jgi:hypothetical protein
MLNRNELWAGALIGLLFPALCLVLLHQVFNILESYGGASTVGFSPNFRERTLAIVAIALNLVFLNIFRRRRWERAMRGVVVATGMLAIAWVLVYGVKLF